MYQSHRRFSTPSVAPGRTRFALGFLALLLGLTAAPWAGEPPTAAELAAGRVVFLQAERALARGDRAGFATLMAGLTGHPLYAYLRFAEVQAGPPPVPKAPAAGTAGSTGADSAQLEASRTSDLDELRAAFLRDFPDTPMAERVRSAHLTRLAEAERWDLYVRFDRPDSGALRRCLSARALLETGRRDLALAASVVEPLWLSAKSQPAACDPVFAAWQSAGGLTMDLVWRRIRLALEAGEVGLARHLGQYLSDQERSFLALWLAVQGAPDQLLAEEFQLADHPMASALLAQGLVGLARTSPKQAERALARWRDRLKSDADAWDRAHEAVARALVRAGSTDSVALGLAVWDLVSAQPERLDQQEDRVRAALSAGDWQRASDWIRRLPAGDAKDDRWLYWLARAEAHLGHEAAAREALERAAGQRSLWGFLAADRLNRPYALESKATPAAPAEIARLAGSAAFARIRELQALGRETDIRREWRTLTRDLDPAGLMAAAWISDLLGRHDQAIFTLARTGYWDDLALRFPLQHLDLVTEQAWQSGLPEDWILAVIRQESVFNPQVASSAGALGLMQLMPATARQVALGPELDRTAPSRAEILTPALNIALGGTYLAWMRDRFGHVALATAAYNAGPHRVERWRPKACMDADLWILSIPFDETRGYVERVLAYRVIYRARLGLPLTRVTDWLPPVPGRADLARVVTAAEPAG